MGLKMHTGYWNHVDYPFDSATSPNYEDTDFINFSRVQLS